MTAGSVSSVLEVSGESKLELELSSGGSFGGSPPGMPNAPGGFWMRMCTEQGGEWKLVAGEASSSEYSSMCAPRVRDLA